MPVIVEIDDTEIEFPDGMSEEEMHRAALQARSPSQSSPGLAPLGPESMAFQEPAESSPDPLGSLARPFSAIPLAGKALRGGMQDAFNIFSPLLYPPRIEDMPEYVRETEAEPPGMPNLQAALGGEPMPLKEDIKRLPVPLQLVAEAGGGLVQTAPQLAGVIGGQALGIPAPISAAALFGITEEGGYDPVAGGIAAALPFVGRASGQIAGSLAQRLGISTAEALNVVKGSAALLAPLAGLAAHGENEISKLPPEEQEAARVELYASLLGQAALGPVGVKWERNYATPKRPIPQSGVSERPTVEARGLPAEAVSRNRVEPSRPVPEAPKIEGLTPEEQAIVSKGVSELDVPVIMTPEGPVDAPFAGRKLGPGVLAAADRETGQIVVNAPELRSWLQEDVPPAQREKAVRSLLNEERLHLSTPDEAALTYLESLTGPERAIAERIYRGENQAPMTPLELGHEALRYRMQQLARMTPREVAEAARKERWTVQGLSVLSGVVRNFREVMGTKASQTGEAIADHILSNLETAQGVIGAPQFAMRKQDVPVQDRIEELKSLPMEDFFAQVKAAKGGLTGEAWRLGRSVENAQEVSALVAARKEASGRVKEAIAQGDLDSAQRFAMQGQFYREAYEAATGTGSAGDHFRQNEPGYKPPVPMDEGALPQARRKKATGQQEFFLPPVERTAKLERPGTEAAPSVQPKLALAPGAKGIERESPFETITPAKVSGAAEGHLSKPVPSFKKFVAESQGQFGTVQRGQLRDVWEDAVWKKVMNASGEELNRLRSELKLVKNFGERDIANPQTEPVSGEGRKVAVAREKYRLAVARGIAEKLIKQSYEGESLKKALGRRELTPDDLAEKRPNFYREIAAEEAADPVALKNLMSEFRASSTLSTRITRRLIALVDKQTGEVHHVSAYLDPTAGLRAVDPRGPARERPNVPIETLLKRYRPISTSLLDEPVKNFHQRYESVSKFNEQFANDARARVEAQGSYDATLGPEAGVIERVAEEPSVLEPGQRMTANQAGRMLDVIYDTVGEIQSPTDIARTVAELKASYKAGKPKWDAIAGFQKAYDALLRVDPNARLKDLYEDLYRKASESKTREAFQKRALRSYGGEGDIADVRGIPEARAAEPSATGRELRALDRPPIPSYPVPTITRGTQRPFPFEPGSQKTTPQARRKGKANAGQFVADSLKEVAEAPHRWYANWLAPVIRAKGGEAGARAADVADKVIDRQKALYGSLTQTLDPARELAGGSTRVPVIGQVPSPRQIAANTWLDKLSNPVSKFTGMANVQGAMEGWKQAPPSVQPVIAAAKRADAAAMAVLAPVVPMTASGKFQRNLSSFGYDMIAEGPSHPQWRRWTGDTALLNLPHLNQIRAQYNQNAIRQNAHNAARGYAIPPIQPLPMLSKAAAIRQFRSFVKEWGDTLKDPVADPNRVEKINQDYQRLYPRALTHVRTPLGWQSIIHSHLPDYLESVAQRAAWTRAFREQFPADATGRQAFADLNSDVRSALPPNITPYWEGLVKAMQGRPADSYVAAGPLRPGTLLGEAVKGFDKMVLGTLKRGALSLQAALGTVETAIGSTGELGWTNKLKAAQKVKQLWPETEKRGQVNAMIYDWSFDPSQPARSVANIIQNLIAKGFAENANNELQGRLNAAMSIVVADRIRNQAAEPLTKWEQKRYPQTFRNMQFTEEQVAAMMQGDDALLSMFERRAPSWLSGENAPKAERSMAGQKRWLNSVFAFQQYPMTIINQFTTKVGALGDAWKTGDKARKAQAVSSMARFLGEKGGQGAIYLTLGTLLSQGLAGVKVRMHEDLDRPDRFLLDSLMATLGGPYSSIWNGLRQSGSVPETLTRTMFPYSQYLDLRDAATGTGRYRDMELGERLGAYLSQKAPISKPVKQALAAFGLSQRNTKLDAAVSGLNRWKRDVFGPVPDFKSDPSDFRTAMKSAVRKLADGDFEGYQEEVGKALESQVLKTGDVDKASQGVSASLLARRKLLNENRQPLTEEQLNDLSGRIGQEALSLIQEYDAMLEILAE